jgi:riboflavin kinase/FMN adenylyltransferase
MAAVGSARSEASLAEKSVVHRTMSRLLTSLRDLTVDLRGGGVAIGNFDAVHVGHVALVRQLISMARQVGGPAIVFTFDPPPGAVLQPSRPPVKPLTTIPRRAELMSKLGVDALIAYPTDADFLQLSARDFFAGIVVSQLASRAMVEGPNFRFGRGREGDIQMLEQLCQESGVRLHVMPLVTADSTNVSSTRIRELITQGHMAEANAMLAQPYRIEGAVVQGAQRGRTLGFPTANLSSIPVLLPGPGVYAGRVRGIGSEPLAAAIHVGPNPTFGEEEPKVEVHIALWHGSLYGKTLQVEVLAQVRGIRKFPSVDELKHQLQADVDQCVRLAGLGA